MTTSAQAVGCIGLLSNGPSRDVDAIRRNKFQMLLGGVTAGHGAMGVMAVQVPVSVGGMDVAPGELIHMDENGAVKFPADKIGAGPDQRPRAARPRGHPARSAAQGEDGRRGARRLERRHVYRTEALSPMQRTALVVRGGWEGHVPVAATDLFIPHLRSTTTLCR